MTSDASPSTSPVVSAQNRSALNAKARTGTAWIVIAFGSGQVVRLALNIVLAALLFEEAFALMALVSAVMIGLAMFSDVGLQQNVIQSPHGDESDFLNTAWTIQVIRGFALTALAMLLAWPMAHFYGANDPAALELRWLIPLVALSALFDGLRSPRMLSAARHMQVAQVTRIEVVVAVINSGLIFGLAWYTRSVYALAIASLVSAAIHTALSYWLMPGPPARFTLEPKAVQSIISFGKWILLSSLLYFLSMQIDRLTFAAMYPLAEVGVYSIAVSLALLIPTLVGRLQSAIVLPWYARMLEDGMGLPEAFKKAKAPLLLISTYLVVLLIVGANSFFELAYDHRYSRGALLLPILAISVWFSNLGGLYGSAFIVKGLSKWLALASAVKLLSFVILFSLLSQFDGTILMATTVVLISELFTAMVSLYLGRRLGLKNLRVEAAMLAMLLFTSGLCLLLMRSFEAWAHLHPALQLLLLGVLVTAMFMPLFLKLLHPILKRRSDEHP